MSFDKYFAEVRARKKARGGEWTLPEYTPASMTVQEILDWYYRARDDFWYQAELPVTQNSFSAACGMRQSQFARDFDRRKSMMAATIERYETAIRKIESREVVWRMKAFDRGDDQKGYGYIIEPQVPPKIPPRRLKISSDNGEFDIFSVCTCCGGNQWLSLDVCGNARIVCYTCVPRSQWPALGATSGKRKLITEYLRRQTPDAELYLSRKRLFQQQGQ